MFIHRKKEKEGPQCILSAICLVDVDVGIDDTTAGQSPPLPKDPYEKHQEGEGYGDDNVVPPSR